MINNIKDLYEGIDDLDFINRDEYDYHCEGCWWQGDQANYNTIQRDIDDEGYPIGKREYIVVCPICGYSLEF